LRPPAEAQLAVAPAVLRRGVEEPDAGVPGGVDRVSCLLVGHLGVHSGDRGGAEAERGHLHVGAAELSDVVVLHSFSP
jgi:hypothetical protein